MRAVDARFGLNKRAQFEFVVSDASEVAARLEGRFTQWAIDVCDLGTLVRRVAASDRSRVFVPG